MRGRPDFIDAFLKISSDDWDRLNQLWKTLSDALDLTIVRGGSLEWDAESINSVNRIKIWFIRLGVRCGLQLAKEIKGLAEWARYHSVDSELDPPQGARQTLTDLAGPDKFNNLLKGSLFRVLTDERLSRGSLFQLSLMGRALPYPSPEQEAKAAAEHRIVLCSDVEYDSLKRKSFLNRVSNLVTSLTKRWSVKDIQRISRCKAGTHVSVSVSAAYSTSVRKGGLGGELNKLLWDYCRQYTVGSFLRQLASADLSDLSSSNFLSVYGNIALHGEVLQLVADHDKHPQGQPEGDIDDIVQQEVKRCIMCQNKFGDADTIPLICILHCSLPTFLGKLTLLRGQYPCRTNITQFMGDNVGEVLHTVCVGQTARNNVSVRWFRHRRTEISDTDKCLYICQLFLYHCSETPESQDSGITGKLSISEESFIPPRVRVHLVKEGGMKCRPITIAQGYWTIVQQASGHLLQSLIELDPRVRLGFRSPNKLWDFCKVFSQRKLEEPLGILSADLTSATDYFGYDLIKTVWTSLFDSLKIPEGSPLRCCEDLFWSPRLASWEDSNDAGGMDFLVTMRGSLMGETQSFLSLSLMSLAVLELAELNGRKFLLEKNPTFNYDMSKLHFPGLCVGDDVIAVCTRETCDEITELYEGVGLKLSRGKHLFSYHAGVLCEDFVEVINNKLVFSDSIKPRLLSPFSRVGGSDRSLPFIGKSSMVTRQIRWIVEDKSSQHLLGAVPHLLNIYLRSFGEEFDRLSNYPIEFPILGFDILYRGYRELNQHFVLHANYLRELAFTKDQKLFLEMSVRLAANESHGITFDQEYDAWGDSLRDLLKRAESHKVEVQFITDDWTVEQLADFMINCDNFKPGDIYEISSLRRALSDCLSNDPQWQSFGPVPRSVVDELIRDRSNLRTVDQIINELERATAFQKQLSGYLPDNRGVTYRSVKKSLARRIKALETFRPKESEFDQASFDERLNALRSRSIIRGSEDLLNVYPAHLEYNIRKSDTCICLPDGWIEEVAMSLATLSVNIVV